MASVFVANFVNTDDPDYYVDKSYRTVKAYTPIINGNTEGLDVLDPVFRISGVNNEIINCNYLYTTGSAGYLAMTRYYYINKFVPITDEVYDVYCHEDVLMTFSSAIYSGKGLITQSGGNAIYNDGSVPKPTCMRVTETQEFKDGFSSKNPTYILLTAGGDNTLSTDY